MGDYNDGDTETINGVTYVRQGGVWHSPAAPQTGPVYGLPLHPPQQTPDQAIGQGLQNTHTQLENQTIPLQQANTRVNIAQGNASIASTQNQIRNTNLDNVNNLRKQFESEQSVQDYKTVLPLMDNAFKLGPNKAGDLNLVYAFGKAMDPNSVVREGEQVMATNVGGVSEKVKGYIAQIEGGGGLTPIQRTQLTEEIRNRARSLQQTYNQRRGFYEDFAKRSGINPGDVVGPHPGQPFIGDEQSYIEAHGGIPHDTNAPLTVAPGHTQAGFDLHSDPRQTQLTPDQAAAYDAWWKAHPNPSPDQLRAFGQSLGLSGIMTNAEAIIAAKKAGKGVTHDVTIKPDITDMRGGGGFGEKADAAIRGAADTASFGLADKAAAVGDTLTNPNTTFDQNLGRQYAISDYDSQNHFPSRLIGQVSGGMVLPMGEMSSVPQIALKSGAAGAAYGAGSSRSFGNVPVNALMGFAGGAALGGAIGGLGKGIGALKGRGAQEVPPLVDPQTGQLNQPLEAMSPGQRVVHAEEYGINLPADAAGGRTAAVLGKGLDINPGSAGVMEDARRATESQIAAASDVVASRFGNSRTFNEAGAELQRGANERIDRGKDVIGKAYSAIPISDTARASTGNTVSALESLTGRFQSNPDLAEAMRDPGLVKYLTAIRGHSLSWKDLKDFRSIIGEKIGEMRFGESHSTSDLRALYGGLSEDMRASAAAQGPGALRAFERANTLNRQNEEMIQGALTRILGKDGQLPPEKAAAAVQAMTRGGKSTGDLKTLAQIRSATIKSGAWNEIAGTLIRLGGQPANSAGRDFNPQTFTNWYADMAEPARSMLFGNSDLRKALDGFVAVNQRLMKVNALRNTSNTAGGLVAAGTAASVTAPVTMAAMGHPVAGLTTAAAGAMTMAGGWATAKAWTNPAIVRWMTGYSKAVASGNQNAVRSQIGRIAKLAATNPDLREPLIALQQRLFANDNVGIVSGAAAGGSDTNSSQQ